MLHRSIPRTNLSSRQCGVSDLVVIAIVAALVAVLAVYKERSRAAAKAERQRVELA